MYTQRERKMLLDLNKNLEIWPRGKINESRGTQVNFYLKSNDNLHQAC